MNRESITRREFLDQTARAGAGLTAAGILAEAKTPSAKKRLALVGTGSRGTSMWGSRDRKSVV